MYQDTLQSDHALRADGSAIQRSRRWCWSLGLLLLLWIIAVSAGSAVLWHYAHSPAARPLPPQSWPAESALIPPTDRAVLVMFTHPKCPCTRASIEELAKLMARHADVLAAQVVFIRPQSMPAGWEETALWQLANTIPGVSVTCDVAGREADLFRGKTSGLTVLYDTDGQLRFFGGITASRGHAGDNAGRSAIESILTSGQATRTETFVFGCALHASPTQATHVRAATSGSEAALSAKQQCGTGSRCE